ncbi:MAG TPA: histidine kinase [Solirubrobacteraceae bacterium]|nr:histidine kinase [Solirubrobacteraceae bacterium]
MEVILGVLVGWATAASALAALRLVRPARVISSEQRAMQEALHAATATLPHLRRGLSIESAVRTVGHLRTLTQALAVALVDRERLLAFAGEGLEHHAEAQWLALARAATRDDRLHVESRIRCEHPGCPLGSAVVAPLVVRGERVGTLLALFAGASRLNPEETRTVADAASLVSAELALAELEAQSERLARAELHALRAQISPHFVYNALAAIAGYIHSNPEEARELLTEFAEFTRYAFRPRSPYVTLAEELGYVEKYLRLERARFGDRLEVRLQVAPEVLNAVLPMLSLQPLVENAVRHGVERQGRGRVEIVGHDIDADVELRVSDDGVGMEREHAAEILSGRGGGVGLTNVQARLQAAFGSAYGLEIESAPGRGTTVTMTLPKFRAGVRAA